MLADFFIISISLYIGRQIAHSFFFRKRLVVITINAKDTLDSFYFPLPVNTRRCSNVYERCRNVIDVRTTLGRRCTDVACSLGSRNWK